MLPVCNLESLTTLSRVSVFRDPTWAGGSIHCRCSPSGKKRDKSKWSSVDVRGQGDSPHAHL